MQETDTTDGQITDGAGLTPTTQEPASSIATVTVDGTVTELWSDLFEYQGVREAFVRSVRCYCRGKTVPALYDDLEARDVPYWLHSRIRNVGLGDRLEAWRLVADIVPALGRGRSTVDDILSTATLFRFDDEAPTLSVRLEYESFSQLRREQRESVCRLIGVLAKAFDVRLVTTGLARSYLRQNHRDDLPGVSDWCNAHRPNGSLDEALETLDPNGREVRILWSLFDEPGETLTYSELKAQSRISDSRVRQCLSRLTDLGLIETYGSSSDKKASLLEVGREYLKAIREEIGRQSRLEESVSGTPKTDRQRRVSPAAREGGEGTAPYRTTFMSRPHHTAAVACSGNEGTVSLVNDAISAYSSKDRLVSFDEERDEAVISTHATNPLDYTVSSAIALASPRFFDRALSVDRLEQVLDEVPGEILRSGRQIGYLSDEALNDPKVLRDNLVSWGTDLEDLTRRLKRGDYDDRDSLVSTIVRSAHGLAGSVVHLLDTAGVSVVREVRVPGDVSNDKLESLAESIAHSLKVQSRYENFAAYRQLFETRPAKREATFTPVVDSTDPVGSLVGSVVLRGPGVGRLEGMLINELEAAKPHDEAPEFTVDVRVREVDRPAFAIATKRMLDTKNIRATSEAVSVVHGLVDTPYAAAYALAQLGKEETPREVRPDELRYALSTLSPAQLVSDTAPTVGKILKALLEATESLSQTELANRADVSTQSIRNHRETLEALDVITVDGTTYRLTLSFDTPGERREPVYPSFVSSGFIDAVDSLLEAVLPPERYGDPNDEVGKVLFWPPNPWGLLDNDDLSQWVELAAALTGTERPERESTVSFGPSIEQAPIGEPSTPAVAD